MSSSFFIDEVTGRSVFYPSMVVNLQLRFDEGMEVIEGAKTPDELAEEGGGSGASKVEPSILKRGKDNLSKVLGIIPRTANVELPQYRQAGTFNMEFDFRDLPLDPRVIRAIGVAVHLDAVDPKDFGDGMTRNTLYGDSLFDTKKRRPSIIETTEDNLLLAGVADAIEAEHGSNSSIVRLSGRDLRGILLDAKVPAEMLKKIDLKKPIDDVVSQIVNRLHPQGEGIKVAVNAEEWPNGTVPGLPNTVDEVTRTNLNALGQAFRSTAKGEVQKMTFWDLITQYCFMVGAVPYFAGSVLRVRPARTLWDAKRQEKTFDPAVGTPFKDGVQRSVSQPLVEKPAQYAFRRLVFGKSINDFKLSRKLGGVKVPTIEVAAYDHSGAERGVDRLIKVQWPQQSEKGARTTSVGPSGETPQTDVLRINVPGVRSKERLLEIAKSIYQEIGRQEMGGSVSTKNLASFGGGNQDPDLIRLRPGDPIEFLLDASGLGTFPPPINELTQGAGRSFEEQVSEVKQRIGDENLARVLVAVNRGQVAGLQTVFRTANVKFSWASGSGVAIAFDFQNYLEARYDVRDTESAGGAFA
jgi:hypothetical protein